MAAKLPYLRVADMPGRDVDAEIWLAGFAQNLARNPSAYGVSAELCNTVSNRVAAFSKAYSAATHPKTKTPVAIEAKTLARNEAVKAVREVIDIINAQPEIRDSQRMLLGLRRRFNERGKKELRAARRGGQAPRPLRGTGRATRRAESPARGT